MTHPLRVLIESAADGRFPAVDGGWTRVPPWRQGLEAVVSFTGHAVMAIGPDVTDQRLVELGVDGFGGAHDPRLVAALAGPDGWIDSLDVLLVGRGAGGPTVQPRLVHRPDLATHPRVAFATDIRDDLEILGHEDRNRSDVAVVARGLAGMLELSLEVEPGRRGGAGRTLALDAQTTVDPGELVVAGVSPGNAASLRALLSAGFTPVGSFQLFRRAGSGLLNR